MKSAGCWNSKGSTIVGRLGLECPFDILVLQLYSLVDCFGLEGCGEVLASTSVSSLITRLDVISLFTSLFPYSLCFTFVVYCICLCTKE